MKNALITGINGLLEKGYNVYGLMRRKSVVDYGNVAHIKDKIHFIYADMTDYVSLVNAMEISQADEVYNLAAQSFVATSWEQPLATANIDALGVTNMLEAIRKVNRRFHRRRRLRFIREVRMVLQSFTVTGLRRITERASICTRAAVFCSTMRARGEGRSL